MPCIFDSHGMWVASSSFVIDEREVVVKSNGSEVPDKFEKENKLMF